MKFIVDKMPHMDFACPFYINGRCFMNHNWMCNYFDNDGFVVDREVKECAMLKEQSDGNEVC